MMKRRRMVSVEPVALSEVVADPADTPIAPAPLVLDAKRAFLIMGFWLVNQIAFAIVLTLAAELLSNIFSAGDLDAAQTLTVASAANVLATFVALDMFAKSFGARREMWSALGLRAASLRAIAFAAAVGCSIAICVGFVLFTWFMPTDPKNLGPLVAALRVDGMWRQIAGLCMVVVAPVLEETMFRGALFTGLARSWHVLAAAAATTTVFALLHIYGIPMYWPALFAVALLGAAAQTARISSGSLWPAMALHFSYNLTNAIGALLRDG